MDMIVLEVERAIDAGFPYLGLVVALTLPDICAALGSPGGKTDPQKYKDWFTNNLADRYPSLTCDDIWSLRNGVVHQGRFGHEKMQYSRILFTLPEARGNVYHNNIVDDALNLDAITFCKDMCCAVQTWYAANKDKPEVAANYPNLVQFRPAGFPPYMVGMPIIA